MKTWPIQEDYPHGWCGAPVVWSKFDYRMMGWITVSTDGLFRPHINVYDGGSVLLHCELMADANPDFLERFIDSLIEIMTTPGTANARPPEGSANAGGKENE
jgi:hypothetical protein